MVGAQGSSRKPVCEKTVETGGDQPRERARTAGRQL